MANSNYPQFEFSEITNLKQIGRGRFGTVYKADWRNKVIAVKDFFPNDERDRQELEKEIKQSFEIGKHGNIIEFYGVSVRDGHTYLLLEYAHGGPLNGVLFGSKKMEYTTEKAISWVYQCAQGVAFLHATKPKPLLHRDLKPANLLLTDSHCETLKICDFGTVRELKTTMTENTGSLAWTAPELFNNRKYTEKCDVYSFAIILWEVFTREEYFRTFNSHWAIPIQVVQGHRPELKGVIPYGIQTLMISCWREDPSERPYMENVVVQMKSILENYSSNGFADVIDRIKIPSEIAYGYMRDIRVREILVLEQLTSLNSIKKEAFDKGLFGITYKAQVELYQGIKILALKVYNRNYLYMERKLDHFFFPFECKYKMLDLYFAFSDERKIYCGLEYIEGGSLYNILHFETKPYTQMDALEWLSKLALALFYFHKQSICVNMLTSRNLFIDRFGKLKIGLPAAEQEANFFKTTYKSAAWMAPEVHEDGKYSTCSDFYSLGIIIWEIWNRKIPFEGSTPDEIAEMVKRGTRPPLKEDEDETIKELLRSCWERDPQSRAIDSVYSILDEMYSKYNNLLNPHI